MQASIKAKVCQMALNLCVKMECLPAVLSMHMYHIIWQEEEESTTALCLKQCTVR